MKILNAISCAIILALSPCLQGQAMLVIVAGTGNTSGGGGSGWTAGPHCSQAATGSSATTTCTITSTAGMQTCWIASAQFFGNAQTDITPSDTIGGSPSGNTWTLVPSGLGSPLRLSAALFVSKGLATGTTHVFKVVTSGTVLQNPIAAFCASGSTVTSGIADGNAAANNTSPTGVTTWQSGNATSSTVQQIFIAVLGEADTALTSIGSSFNLIESINPAGSVTQGLYFAYKLEPTATTENPVWTLAGTSGQYNAQAQTSTFKSQ